jgi:hypothetical protein
MGAVDRSSPRRPGLCKATVQPLVVRRHVELWYSSDYRVREMFEQADVMSEGAARQEGAHSVYYGTTSIVLPVQSKGGHIPDLERHDTLRLLACDPHARVRAVRIAWREARVRSAAPLGQLRAELVFSLIELGVKIDVDVEACTVHEVLTSRSTG